MLQALALLCGGKSSRFGSNKAFAKQGESTLIENMLMQLKELHLPIILVTNTPEEYAFLNLPCLTDSRPYAGPLAALLTVFEKTSYEHVLLLACDMPRLDLRLLKDLLDRKKMEACVPQDIRGPQYLMGYYSRSLQKSLEDFVSQGGKSFRVFFQQHPDLLTLMDAENAIPNVNTLKDWEEFQCSAI